MKMTSIKYKVIDWAKVKNIDDIVLILKSHSDFIELKSAEGQEWTTLGHLLSDEIFVEQYGVDE